MTLGAFGILMGLSIVGVSHVYSRPEWEERFKNLDDTNDTGFQTKHNRGSHERREATCSTTDHGELLGPDGKFAIRITSTDFAGNQKCFLMCSNACSTFSSSYLRPTSCRQIGASLYVSGESSERQSPSSRPNSQQTWALTELIIISIIFIPRLIRGIFQIGILLDVRDGEYKARIVQ